MGITPLPSLRASPHCHHCWASPHHHHCGHCPTPIIVDITPLPSLQALPNPHHYGHCPIPIHCRHCPVPITAGVAQSHHCGHCPTSITVGITYSTPIPGGISQPLSLWALSKPQHCWSWTFLLEGFIQESLLHCSAWWDPRASCHPSLATE